MLADLVARLTPEGLVDTARALESRRAASDEAALVAHHGYRMAGLWTTPFMWQAAAVAREHGVVAFDRQERDLLEAPAAWAHPEIGPGYYRVQRGPERVIAPSLWPFAQDMAVADFDTTGAHQWFGHGLVHTLIGFGAWPSVTEWEVMAMARLSEALAATHWYNLAQLGRLTRADLPMDLTHLRGEEAARYLRLERACADPAERLARLGDPAAVRVAENALDILRYEVFAYRAAIWDGDLVEPEDPLYLGLGEAGEYAKVHHPRLVSPPHARWREACLVPERDYATSAEGFESRVAQVLERLLTPFDPAPLDPVAAPAPGRARARRVLQDVGWRICHLAALGDDPTSGHEPALRAVADGIAKLLDDADPTAGDDVLAPALDAARAALGDAAARRVFALGYRPTLDPAKEPVVLTGIRVHALVARTWRLHPVVGAAVESLVPVARRAVALPREAPLIDALTPVSELAAQAGEIPWEGYAYLGWLQVPYAAWFDGPPAHEGQRWHYRIARRTMPEDPASWERFTVVWNPYAKRTPSPWDARWNDDLRRMTPTAPGEPPKKFKPRPATAAFYVLMGPGRDGPIYLPLTPHLGALVSCLKKPRRLSELCASRDFGPDFMRRAIADEAVLVMHAPLVDRPERTIDIYEMAMAQAATIDQRVEAPGPWNEPDMAEAYVAFCQRSTLYRDTSRALCDAADIRPEARVGELGSGSGETSAEVLARLGPDGMLVGSDPAVLMLEHVIKRFAASDEARAVFIAGAARSLAFYAAGQGAFDRVVANSALVLTGDIEAELVVVAGALKPGGKVAFSLPAEYLGVTDHMTTPEAAQALGAVTTAREELGLEPPEAARAPDPALGSPETLRAAMERAGYVAVRFETYRRPWRAAEYLDWLALPVVRNGLCKPGQEHRSEALIARLRELVDPELALESVWIMAVGTKPDEAQGAG